ncbi:MAG: ferritin-like domain-containing protein [Pseudomonadota bacterium]
MTRAPAAKRTRVDTLAADLAAGRLQRAHPARAEPLAAPGRPDRPALVHPSKLARRSLGSSAGRCALLHAVAHIEFNAINLALDAVYRFRGMPDEFYGDWVSVAVDEARHFDMIAGRLVALGSAYGELPAHNGLWEMACKTADDALARMALVPRVLEARGLDVSPGMIERLVGAGDATSADLLRVILREEERHVAIGTRWFEHLCAERGLEPQPTFLRLLAEAGSRIQPPLNRPARLRAGFTDRELDALLAQPDAAASG